MMSVFLMGVYDKSRDKFCTVAKCGNGHDDSTIARLQTELDMIKISKVHCTCMYMCMDIERVWCVLVSRDSLTSAVT